ncbi:hypothetical protein D3C73_558470 [compost metagenome]
MYEHNLEKRRVEHEAVKLFINLVNARSEGKIRLLYQRERPDAVLENTLERSKFGVEITHLFYNECEAKRMFGRSNQEDCGLGNFTILLNELNSRIARKEATFTQVKLDYSISLLIRNASPLYGLNHFIANVDQIARSRHIFQDIWLLTRDGEMEWHLYRLPDEIK